MLPWRKRQDSNLHTPRDASLVSNEVRYVPLTLPNFSGSGRGYRTLASLLKDGHGLANRHITALPSPCMDRQGGRRTDRLLIFNPRDLPVPATCPHGQPGTRREIRTHTVLFLKQTPPASWAIRANLVQAEGLEPSMCSAWVGRVTADCRRRWATPAY